jgi:hypothetical protein
MTVSKSFLVRTTPLSRFQVQILGAGFFIGPFEELWEKTVADHCNHHGSEVADLTWASGTTTKFRIILRAGRAYLIWPWQV